jgi:hypothetical protein
MSRRSRLSPEEEAGYALTYGSREDLSPEARVIYDRLKAERAEREPSVADTEAASRQVVDDARKAFADCRRVFLCRVPMMYDRLIALGTSGLPGPSSVIESIENLGWRLDQMSWVSRPVSGFRAEGIFLFRRAAE